MSHRLYQTDAFILGSYPSGEAHRVIDLLTRDLGRVRAVARSIRRERSKLRYSVQDFSLSEISLVRGKDVWRLTGAVEQMSVFRALAPFPEKQELMARFAALLRRLLPGEEPNTGLFNIIEHSLRFLMRHNGTADELCNLECLVVFRVLHNLGYVARDVESMKFLATDEVTPDAVAELSPLRAEMIKKINASLQESQL